MVYIFNPFYFLSVIMFFIENKASRFSNLVLSERQIRNIWIYLYLSILKALPFPGGALPHFLKTSRRVERQAQHQLCQNVFILKPDHNRVHHHLDIW